MNPSTEDILKAIHATPAQTVFVLPNNKNIRVDASVEGDLKEVLTELNGLVEQKINGDWTEYIRSLKEKYPLQYPKDKLTCPYIIEEIDRVTKGKAIYFHFSELC